VARRGDQVRDDVGRAPAQTSRSGVDVTSTDPRGPLTTIVEVRPPTCENPKLYIKLACGHEPDFNPIFSYRVGDLANCFACRAASPEGNR
jgi:hypothetical protein